MGDLTRSFNKAQKMNSRCSILFLLVLCFWGALASPVLPESSPMPLPLSATPKNMTLEYIDPTLPPFLPEQTPKCSLLMLQEDFADTVGLPPVTTNYTPPSDCPGPWSRVVLELSGVASDVQKDRTAAVWIGGAEVLRTSTPLPMSPGVFWRVRKDITRYTAILRGSSDGIPFSIMLENSNTNLPGVYSVNVSLHFYRGVLCDHSTAREENTPEVSLLTSEPKNEKLECALSGHPTIKGLYREPADLIIPISNEFGDCSNGGYWFRVENETDVQVATIPIPNNTYRAVLEIYVSAHGDDEYWYANPIRSTPLSERESLASAKANGGFRQVVLTIDGRYAGAIVPFPVIQPGSVNPFFWAPVTAIGAYDHPSYDLDITPFVGLLLNGEEHEFGLTVKDALSHWFVSANLHLWLDALSDGVEGALVRYKVPPLRLNRQANWRDLDGKSAIDGQMTVRFSGWVSSSKGNITTSIRQRLKFRSHVGVQGRGTLKHVEMENKARTNVRLDKDHTVIARVAVTTEAPLSIQTMISNGGGGTILERTKLYHVLQETRSAVVNKEVSSSTMTDRQLSEGSVLSQDGAIIWGKGDTKSTYKYRDDKTCYLRTVIMVGGSVKDDVESPSCISMPNSESSLLALSG